MNRLRQHQQLRDVMVNEGRNESRPFWVLINLGRKDCNNSSDVPVHIKKDVEMIFQNWGHPSVQHMEKLFRKTKMSDEAAEALKHRVRCVQSAEATSRSKTDGHCQRCLNGCDLWKLKERNSREKKTLTVLDIQSCKSDIAHAMEDHRERMASLGWRAKMSQSGSSSCQISKDIFDQVEGRGIFADPVPAEAHWHIDIFA